MKATGKIIEASRDFKTGKPRFTIQMNVEPSDELDDLINADLVTVEIKKYKQKRSLDANAYAWVLIDKLAEVLNKSKTEVYREAIKDIGGVSDTSCMRAAAAEKFAQIWRQRGIGWQCDIKDSKIPGCKNVTYYYGSSTYDTAQMSRLIDLLTQECKDQGITLEEVRYG